MTQWLQHTIAPPFDCCRNRKRIEGLFREGKPKEPDETPLFTILLFKFIYTRLGVGQGGISAEFERMVPGSAYGKLEFDKEK